MMNILIDGLFLILGIASGGVVGLPSLALAGCGPWLAETVGRRWKYPIERQRRGAVVVVTMLIALHVVWMWFLSGWLIRWLGCTHGLAIQAGATIGALLLGCIAWIFICCALDQMIKDPPMAQRSRPVPRIDADEPPAT